MAPVLGNAYPYVWRQQRGYGISQGGITPSTPGGAWLWLADVKAWSAVVGSTPYTASQSAGLAMVLKL